mmetsp:Transcript_46316/g.110241  ORF Transcript_46316/g.110241 Transcript_46316/m.110241 type:complete len:1169 (+) Transcript_46316:127-3633(+)
MRRSLDEVSFAEVPSITPREPANTPPKLDVRPFDDLELESVDNGSALGLLRVSNDDLQEAALKNDLGLVRRLTQAGASVNAPMRAECSDDFMSLLHVLAQKPQIPNGTRMMREVCRSKANLNARSTSGATPLMHACQKKHVGAIEVLLEAGADWQPVDDAGMACLQYCVAVEEENRELDERLSVELLDMMHKAGVGLNFGGKNSPITEAVIEQNLPAVQALLDLGADPDGINEAVASAPAEFIKILIEHEVNPFHRNEDHKNAMDLAILRGDHEITQMLRDYIGNLQRQKHPHLHTQEEEPEPFPAVEEDRKNERVSLIWRMEQEKAKAGRRSVRERCLSDHRLQQMSFLSQKLVEQASYGYFLLLTIVFAIYFPGLWVLSQAEEDAIADSILLIVLCIWCLDGCIQALAAGFIYIGKFFFCIDVLGIVSIILDMSFVRNAVRDSNDIVFGATTPERAASARFLRLLVRAGQLLKLLKVLQHLPVRRKAQAARGTAKTMSRSLAALLSARTGALVVTLAVVVPIIEVYTYPTIDWSMRMWVEELEWRASYSSSALSAKILELESFYNDKTHFPIEAVVAAGTEMWTWPLQSPPTFDIDRVRVTSKSGMSYIDFNFEDVVRWVAISNLLLSTALILIILFASWLLQRSVARVLFTPIDALLRGVRHTARSIIKSITSMAGKLTEEASLAQTRGGNKSTETLGREVTLGEEMELLEKVLNKLQVLQSMTKKEDASHEDDIDEHQKALLADYVHEVPIHAMTAAYSITGHGDAGDVPASFPDFSEIQAQVDERFESRLFDHGMAYDSLLNWSFDVLQLTNTQSQELGVALLDFYRPASLLPDGSDDAHDLTLCYRNFMVELQKRYKSRDEVPYHNFLHGMDVACMVFRLLQCCHATAYLVPRDLFALMVASLAHDVGHPGVNNPFLVETHHDLAIRYNDHSPLENMHCATLFEIAADDDKHIFAGLERYDYRHLRHTVVEAILNTDAHTHFARIKELKFIYESSQELFDRVHQKHKNAMSHKPEFPSPEVLDIFIRPEVTRQLRNLFLYFADISNPMRPWEPCRQWACMIMEEFARQGDRERGMGLPVQGLHDRNTINMAYSQIGFIEYFTAPLSFAAANLLPPLDICDEMLVTNANFWYEEWVETTDPVPSSAERAKVKDRIHRMEGRCP